MMAPFLAYSLVNILKPEYKSQFTLIKNFSSTNMNDFLIYENIPFTLYYYLNF